MADKIPERLVWAVRALELRPADHVLEIGCGRGLAVAPLCEQLPAGRVTAIDRSAAAIEAAEQRNAAHVRSGRARLHRSALADAADALDGEVFDKIFAVNVNLFWVRPPTRELALLARLLRRPGGTLHLFYGYGTSGGSATADSTARAGQTIQTLTTNLSQGGFTVTTTQTPGQDGSPVIYVAAHPR